MREEENTGQILGVKLDIAPKLVHAVSLGTGQFGKIQDEVMAIVQKAMIEYDWTQQDVDAYTNGDRAKSNKMIQDVVALVKTNLAMQSQQAKKGARRKW